MINPGTLTIVAIVAILVAAAMACGLGRRTSRRADGFAPPPPNPTNGFRDPYR
jgi:hypothetical protein